jgi:hypothetical protein
MNNFEVFSNYYIYNKNKYIISFPIVWLDEVRPLVKVRPLDEDNKNEEKGDCLDCKKYGMFDDIFYFYCKICLNEKYDGTRGNSKLLNMDEIEKISPDIFEQFVNFYYENFDYSDANNKAIQCYGCSDDLSLNEALLEQRTQFITDQPSNHVPGNHVPGNHVPGKHVQILCPECRNFPEHENWPPLGS